MKQYLLVYSEPCQTSKIKRFPKIVMGKDSIKILLFFDNCKGQGTGKLISLKLPSIES